ncbi:hypothetical protein CHU98_g5404 [Xylaria longipes]|nr:hypothetical protein CHU98_g5404 [Xylaria longipes]
MRDLTCFSKPHSDNFREFRCHSVSTYQAAYLLIESSRTEAVSGVDWAHWPCNLRRLQCSSSHAVASRLLRGQLGSLLTSRNPWARPGDPVHERRYPKADLGSIALRKTLSSRAPSVGPALITFVQSHGLINGSGPESCRAVPRSDEAVKGGKMVKKRENWSPRSQIPLSTVGCKLK